MNSLGWIRIGFCVILFAAISGITIGRAMADPPLQVTCYGCIEWEHNGQSYVTQVSFNCPAGTVCCWKYNFNGVPQAYCAVLMESCENVLEPCDEIPPD